MTAAPATTAPRRETDEAREIRLAYAEAERRGLARNSQLREEAQRELDTSGIAAAIEGERERCARICERFPGNLMARHLAGEIRKATREQAA